MPGMAELGWVMLRMEVDMTQYKASLEASEAATRAKTKELEAINKQAAKNSAAAWGQMAGAVGLGMSAYDIVREGVQLVRQEIVKSIAAGKEAIANERELTLLAGDHATAVRALASAYQIKFGIDDDEIKKSAVMAARMNVQKELLADVAKAAFQYSKVMGVDMDSATSAVVGGLEGMGRGFKKLGIEVDANKSQLENLNAILAGTKQGFKIAADEMKDAEGAQKRLAMWVDELREKYGVAILSNEKFIAALNEIGDTVMRAVEDGNLEQMADDVGAIAHAFAKFIDIAESGQKYLRPFIEWISGNWIGAGRDAWKLQLELLGLSAEKTEEVGQKAEDAQPKIAGVGDALATTGQQAEESASKMDIWGNALADAVEFTTDALRTSRDEQGEWKRGWEDMSWAEKIRADYGHWAHDMAEMGRKMTEDAVKAEQDRNEKIRAARQEARESIAQVFLDGDDAFKAFLKRQYPGIEEWADKWKIASMDAGERIKYFYDQAHQNVASLAQANSQAAQQMHMDWSIVEADVSRFNEGVRAALGLMHGMQGAGFLSPKEQELRARELLMNASPGTAAGEAMIQTALQMLQGAVQNASDQKTRAQQMQQFLQSGKNPFDPQNQPGSSPSKPQYVKVVNDGGGADAFAMGLA